MTNIFKVSQFDLDTKLHDAVDILKRISFSSSILSGLNGQVTIEGHKMK